MRESPKFGFKDAEEMLQHYKNIRATVEAKLPKLFGTLPTIKYNIEPIPEDLAPAAPAAYYNEPSPDGRPGIKKTFFHFFPLFHRVIIKTNCLKSTYIHSLLIRHVQMLTSNSKN